MKITEIVNENGCFNLQFRRDIRYKRTGKPVYYSWKAQFVIILKTEQEEILREIKKILQCGELHFINQGSHFRYSVQSINDLYQFIVPYFENNPLSKTKQKDFILWAEAIKILYQHKGQPLLSWPKQDFLRLIEIQKSMSQYKSRKIKSPKWLNIAESIAQQLQPTHAS